MPLPDFTMLANRLRKFDRHLRKWAKREGVSCYRLYDADIPEFPIAIDRYEDCLHAAEYRRNNPLTPEEYRGWRLGCRETMAEVLEVPQDRIFFKEREQQKGKNQYEKRAERGHELVAHEGGLQFWVNLADYLDTGLFLDHRPLRQRVRAEANGRRVLNLFAYTGSFTVYAAAGGAAATTTIDLSNTYLQWAERNLALNNLTDPARHEFIRADVKQWLRQRPQGRYDLIVLDPPTFSNSKAMYDILDTQRDHAELINHCLALLAPGGVVYFSTNYRRFKLDTAALHSSKVQDISAQTIPPDFRNPKIHYCFRIER